MVLTAYRVLLLQPVSNGALAGGCADVTCFITEIPEGGVVCNSCADVEFIPAKERPILRRCFKFRPRERAYVCATLQPVHIISAMSLGENCNVYAVSFVGRVFRMRESELCTLSEATMKQKDMSILYEKQVDDLENTPIQPDPIPGKLLIEIPQPPIISGNAIRERALREVDRLRAIRTEC